MKRIDVRSIAPISLAIGLAVGFVFSTSVARADTWDKKTTVSFSQPVEVPGYVLQPGRYVMKLVNFPSDRHVVQFMNERENHVYAAAMAIPAYRTEVTDHTVLTFYEARGGQPEPIRNWYYPGDNFGQEFVYSKEHLAEIAAVPHEVTPTAFDTRTEANSGPLAAAQPIIEPAPAPVVSEQTAPQAPEEAPNTPEEIAQAAPPPDVPATAPENQAPAAPAELPKTYTQVPEIALLGLIFIGGAVTARKLRRT